MNPNYTTHRPLNYRTPQEIVQDAVDLTKNPQYTDLMNNKELMMPLPAYGSMHSNSDYDSQLPTTYGGYDPAFKYPNDENGGSIWGTFMDNLGGIGEGLKGLGSVATAYTGYQNYKLAKDQAAFNKELARANFDRQALVTNMNIAARNASQQSYDPKGWKDPYVGMKEYIKGSIS